MRDDILLAAVSRIEGPGAVLLILSSDAEYMINKKKSPSYARARSLEELQAFNHRITRATLQRLVDDKLVRRKGNGFVLGKVILDEWKKDTKVRST